MSNCLAHPKTQIASERVSEQTTAERADIMELAASRPSVGHIGTEQNRTAADGGKMNIARARYLWLFGAIWRLDSTQLSPRLIHWRDIFESGHLEQSMENSPSE